ncbi:alpha/beta hydrolase [Streptomyces sp. NPDC046876]|uniref:alpha/beta hydrolase n=1 Tax=Streptomyces sp. NPDC046876 TaxID=3155616 RepID=UPI0033F98613
MDHHRPAVAGGGAADRPALDVLGGVAEHGAVLLLPGRRCGGSGEPSPGTVLPSLRMRPFAAAVLRATPRERVLVGRVRYRHQGRHADRADRADRADPVHDARRALRELRALAGPLPVVLVGHSAGARAALAAAGDPYVQGVVALAPWCPPGVPVGHLRGRHVIALHDEADRVTRAVDTWSYLARADAAGARVLGIAMPYGGHAMLRTARDWHRLTAAFAAAMFGLAPFPVPAYGR